VCFVVVDSGYLCKATGDQTGLMLDLDTVFEMSVKYPSWGNDILVWRGWDLSEDVEAGHISYFCVHRCELFVRVVRVVLVLGSGVDGVRINSSSGFSNAVKTHPLGCCGPDQTRARRACGELVDAADTGAHPSPSFCAILVLRASERERNVENRWWFL
jgi:hypothetical protein